MKQKLFIKGMLTFNALIFLLTILDFLALHDIAKDYLSRDALKFAEITAQVPAWTVTEGEWLILQLSLFARVLFFLLNIFLLWFLLKKRWEEKNDGSLGFRGSLEKESTKPHEVTRKKRLKSRP